MKKTKKEERTLTEVESFYIDGHRDQTNEVLAEKLGVEVELVQTYVESKPINKPKRNPLDDFGQHATRKEAVVAGPNTFQGELSPPIVHNKDVIRTKTV